MAVLPYGAFCFLAIIRMAHRTEYDAALVFSQDQDLSGAAEEIRVIAREQNRWIKVVSCYPVSPTAINRRGIASSNKTSGKAYLPVR